MILLLLKDLLMAPSKYLDQFCIRYINNIMIFSKTFYEHYQQVQKVLMKHKESRLFIKAENYEFSINKTMFLNFIISENGIEIDPE